MGISLLHLGQVRPFSQTTHHFHLAAASLIFLLALILRLGFIWQTHATPEFRSPTPGMDIDLHWQAAQELRRSDREGPNFALKMASAPAHIAYLALGQAVMGESLLRHRILGSLLGAASVLLIYWTSWSVTRSRGAALTSGLAAASLPSLVYFQSMVLKPSLGLPMLALLLALTCRPNAGRLRPLSFGLGIGTVLALLYAIQKATFLYPIVMTVYFATNPELARLSRLKTVVATWVVFLAVFWVPFGPAKLLGLTHSASPPVAGVHCRIGFHAGANGTYQALKGIPPWSYGHAFVSRLRAEVELGRRLTPEEAEHYYLGECWRFVFGHGREALALIGKKLGLFFNNYEAKGNQHFDRVRKQALLLDWLPLRFGSLLMLSTWGVIVLVGQGRRRSLILLLGIATAVLLANLLTFVTWRYRIDVVVPMLILAGPGALLPVRGLIELGRSGPRWWRRFARFSLQVLLPGIVVAFIASRPVDPELLKHASRVALRNERLSQRAEAIAPKLAKLESVSDPATGEALRIRLLIQKHRHSAAFRQIEGMLAQGRLNPFLIARFVTYLAWLGEAERAADLLSRLEREAPVIRAEALRWIDPLVRAWLELDRPGL